MDPSVELMWMGYLAHQPQHGQPSTAAPPSWYFCANEADANECAQLVLSGTKCATTPSLWFFESSGEALPRIGDLNIVTDWRGQAVCIIRTTQVQILPFNEISAAQAAIEGEGDGSLEWWCQAHWDYYHQELQGSGYQPQPDMPVVFQQFECIFPIATC